MTTISLPDTTVNIIAAAVDVANTPQKVLFVGQQLSGGSNTSGDLEANISNSSAVIEALYGAGSILAEMLIRAKEINKEVQFDAIGLDDGAATKRIVDATLVGTATAAGTITITVGSAENFSIDVVIALGDSETVAAAAVAAAAVANIPNAPFDVTSAVGVITFGAKNGGLVANGVGVEITVNTAGLVSTLAETTPGAVDPTLTDVFLVIGETRYQTIVWPYDSDVDEVKDFLDARFNVVNDIQDGVGIISAVDSAANLITLANLHNSQSIVILGDRQETETNYIGPAILEMPYVAISYFAAIRSLRFTEGASISQFVISRNGSLDSFGGPALASKPYFNTPIAQLPIIKTGRGFTRTDIADLTDAGIAVEGNNVTSTTIILGQIPTTYKTDSAANPDLSFKFLNYVDTSSNAREYFWNNLRAAYAQSRLTTGDLIKGRDMANVGSIRAFVTGLYADLAGSDFVLTIAGEDALQFYKTNLVVTIDLLQGLAVITMKTPIVTQLRIIVATMQISFSPDA